MMVRVALRADRLIAAAELAAIFFHPALEFAQVGGVIGPLHPLIGAAVGLGLALIRPALGFIEVEAGGRGRRAVSEQANADHEDDDEPDEAVEQAELALILEGVAVPEVELWAGLMFMVYCSL